MGDAATSRVHQGTKSAAQCEVPAASSISSCSSAHLQEAELPVLTVEAVDAASSPAEQGTKGTAQTGTPAASSIWSCSSALSPEEEHGADADETGEALELAL